MNFITKGELFAWNMFINRVEMKLVKLWFYKLVRLRLLWGCQNHIDYSMRLLVQDQNYIGIITALRIYWKLATPLHFPVAMRFMGTKPWKNVSPEYVFGKIANFIATISSNHPSSYLITTTTNTILCGPILGTNFICLYLYVDSRFYSNRSVLDEVGVFW